MPPTPTVGSWLACLRGYEPIAVETMEAAKDEVEKLPPGAVINS